MIRIRQGTGYDSLKRVSAAKASAVPYVMNQGFEQTLLSPWTAAARYVEGVDYEITDVSPHTGTYSLTANTALVSQTVPCHTSASYTLSGYYKSPGTIVPTVSASLGGGGGPYSLGYPRGDWTAFTETFSSGSSCGAATITIAGGSFDDLILTSSATGSTNLLSDAGFENNNQTANWTLLGNSRPTTTNANSGVTSLLVPAGGSAIQTVYGCVPSTLYTVAAFYMGGTASLQVGTGNAATGSPAGWTSFFASGNSDSSGRLTITLSSTLGTSYFDDLTMNTINVPNPTLTWGQQFGYDGFGSLLSQQVLAGTAPSMTLSVNPLTNRVTNTGVVYDAAGNLTKDGTFTYSYDELNRLISVGALSYGYNGDNKRVVVYNNFTPTAPAATLNLYAPNGQRLSSFTYQYNGSTWIIASPGNATNYLYLGSKPLNYSDDPVGSNASAAQYFPYGQVQNGSTPAETQAFGSYVQDESGLLYGDQRYLYQNWGRFLTPDPSDKNIDYTNPLSLNRYSYSNGDPINGADPTGLEDVCNYLCVDPGASDSTPWDTITAGFQFIGDWFNPPADLGFNFSVDVFLQTRQPLNFPSTNFNPSVCGGGVFGMLGPAESFGPISGEVGVIAAVDSQSGYSLGGIAAAGAGGVAVGGEYLYNVSEGAWQPAAVGFGGPDSNGGGTQGGSSSGTKAGAGTFVSYDPGSSSGSAGVYGSLGLLELAVTSISHPRGAREAADNPFLQGSFACGLDFSISFLAWAFWPRPYSAKR